MDLGIPEASSRIVGELADKLVDMVPRRIQVVDLSMKDTNDTGPQDVRELRRLLVACKCDRFFEPTKRFCRPLDRPKIEVRQAAAHGQRGGEVCGLHKRRLNLIDTPLIQVMGSDQNHRFSPKFIVLTGVGKPLDQRQRLFRTIGAPIVLGHGSDQILFVRLQFEEPGVISIRALQVTDFVRKIREPCQISEIIRVLYEPLFTLLNGSLRILIFPLRQQYTSHPRIPRK